MKQGWISLHRKIQEHWLWKNSKPFSKVQAWLDILMECNHEDEKVLLGIELFVCKRGQSVKSQVTWAERWGWNITTAKRFLRLLESDSMIELKTNNKTTLLTVLNYDTYQNARTSDEHQTNNKRTSDEHQMNTNNNDNNGNNGNNKSLSHPSGDDSGKKKKKTEKNFTEDSIEYRMAKYLYDIIKQRNPNNKKANLQSWAKYIDLLLRVDERDLKEAVKVLEFSQADKFWQNVILSTKQFRDKYDQLKLKMESNKHAKHGNGSNGSYKKLGKGELDFDAIAEHLRNAYEDED